MSRQHKQNQRNEPAAKSSGQLSSTIPIAIQDLQEQEGDMHLHIRMDGQSQPRCIPLARRSYTIGREQQVDIPIMAPSVSRRHARLFFLHGEEIIEDLGSTNGVRVNGVRVSHCVLQNNDMIHIGDIALLFTSKTPNGS